MANNVDDSRGKPRLPWLTPAERQAVRFAQLMQETTEAGEALLAAIESDGDLREIERDVRGALYVIETAQCFVEGVVPGCRQAIYGS